MENSVEASSARAHFKEPSVSPFNSLIGEIRETQEGTCVLDKVAELPKWTRKTLGLVLHGGAKKKGEALRRLCDIQLEVALLKKEIL